MAKLASKREFLARVMCTRVGGKLPPLLMTDDDYVRDNIRVACQALSLGLIRIVRDVDGFGHFLRTTPAGVLLLADRIEAAAAEIDAGRTLTRISGPELTGPIALRLQPGSAGMPVDGMAARSHAPEILRGIASGHVTLQGETLHGANPGQRKGSSPMVSSLAARNLDTGQRRRAGASR